MMTEFLTHGQKILAQQAFSQLLGAELIEFVEGKAVLRLAVRAELLQQHGFVHGGVLAYLADNALTYAGGSVLSPVLTSEFKINYIRPAVGDFLIARASVLYAGKTQAVCRCDIFAVQGSAEKLCATAQGTIVKFGDASDSN